MSEGQERETKEHYQFTTRKFSYQDMLGAFSAGQKHQRECGDTDEDCWDFATWIKTQYAK